MNNSIAEVQPPAAMSNSAYHLQIFHQAVMTQLNVLEWARSTGSKEVDELLELLPNPLMEFPGELTLTGRTRVEHWDELDPLLTQLQYRVGALSIESDEPELRIRTYKANGHPYLTVKLRVEITPSVYLTVGTRIHENPVWEYFWVDNRRER